MKNVIGIIGMSLMISSCATIFGGSKYIATITPSNPDAVIYVNGREKGKGEIVIKHKRNKTMFVEAKYSQHTTKVNITKKFRWGIQAATLGGSLLYWPVLPLGLAVDLITGSAFKPNENVKGVNKIDNKNYQINVN